MPNHPINRRRFAAAATAVTGSFVSSGFSNRNRSLADETTPHPNQNQRDDVREDHHGHWVLLGAAGRLVLCDPKGSVRWEMPWGSIHDLHLTDDGHILTRRGKHDVVWIDPATKSVVRSLDVRQYVDGKVELHAFEPIDDGRVMVALSGPAELVELNVDGSVHHRIAMTVDRPSLHSDTRLVRRGPDGDYWVAHENDGCVRRYDRDGDVVWTYRVPMFDRPAAPGHGPAAFGNQLFAAVPDVDGVWADGVSADGVWIGTGNGHGVLHVTRSGQIDWQLTQDELSPIRLAWVTNVHLTDHDTVMVGNCHAGPGQPVLIEIQRDSKRVVWQLDGHDRFGNNVSNTLPISQQQTAPFGV